MKLQRKVACVALALALAPLLGCPASEGPKPVVPTEPLVIGKSPPGASLPVASDKPAPEPFDESGKYPRGNTPAIWLDSLTTRGKATMPAGKVVIVHFWATWCGPCAKSFPALQAMHAKYSSRGLVVVAISVDDQKDGVADYAKGHGARFPVAWDEDHVLAMAWKVDSMPSTMVVGKDGNLIHTHKGWHDGEEADLERELLGLL